MSSLHHSRQGGAGIRWIHGFLGVSALLALLVARSVPPQFASMANSASAIHAVSGHDQRPRFNFDETNRSLATRSFQPFQSAAKSRHIAPESSSLSSLQATGLHYNRPPPSA